MQNALKNLRRILTDLEMAVDGSIVMYDMLDNAMNSLCNGGTPDSWRKISWMAAP
jgi:hypothetical protein